MNTKFNERRKFVKLASGLLVTPFASLAGRSAMAADAKPPLRMLTIIDSYGIPSATRNEIWIKSTAGDYALVDDDLGTILSPLKAYKDNMLVVSGINLDSLGGESRLHDSMARHALTGSQKVSGGGATAKILHSSLDVHIGQYLNDDYGLARAYPHLFFTNTSAASDTTFCYDDSGNQIRSIAGARAQATSIFGSDDNVSNLQFKNQIQQNVFDLVQKQVQALRGQLNNANANTVIEAYESSVDDLAAQLQLSSENVCGIPGGIDSYPENPNYQSTNSTPYIFNNIQQAFSCDLTSSLTYAIGGEQINQLKHADLYKEEFADTALQANLAINMHAISHRVNDAANKAHELIRIHQSELIANLLDNMSTTTDVDGSSMLDNTVVFWTSAMASNTHEKKDFPYLLIAGKNTNLKGGYHYDCTGSRNNDLLTTIAQGMTLPDERFGGNHNSGVYLDSWHTGAITKMLNS